MTDSRRSFLRWATHGLGAIFGAVLGFPAVCYLIDPRNRPAAASNLRPVQGIKLGELELNKPVQGVIRDVRRDAWTLHPNDVVGRVWVRRVKEGETKDCYIVWNTVCPHLGCSINLNADPSTGFTCPCHNAQFTPTGAILERDGFRNPAPRPMDTLDNFEVDRDPENPEDNLDLLRVEFVNFQASHQEKKPVR